MEGMEPRVEPARPSDTWVVVAAYNEAQTIGQVLAELLRLPCAIVVVDDGSEDATAARALAAPVVVLRHPCNLGQGAALQTGIDYALAQPDVRYVVTFDADGQHRAEDVARLVETLREGRYDVALGSRFLAEGAAIGIDARRRALLRLATLLTRATTGLRLTDTHNGLRAFTAEAAARLRISQNRMAHASELLAQIAAADLRYREVPVTVRYTDYSRAKGQKLLDSLHIVWDSVRLRLR